MSADSLKPKHVVAAVERWKADGIAIGTIKNRMTALRWWAEKIGKDNVVARSNAAYGIGHRTLVTNISKGQTLNPERLAAVADPFTAVSLRLQAAFGLRREESIKIVPSWADMGDTLRLKASWTKGGRYREVPITTTAQREALDAAKALAKNASLIPKHMSYRDQLNRFKSQCDKAGIHRVHGLRHQYAQARYEALAGRKCPAAGGPTSRELTPLQKARDREVRLAISEEMGHFREQITAVYLGR